MKNDVNTKSVAVNELGTNISKSFSSSQPRCILRLPEVIRRTGFKRSYVYQLMREGKFPQALRIGVRSVGWDSYAVEQWIEERLNQRE
ncbi:AlpA family transcriptional regulator [Orbus mooreae]